MGTYNAYDLEKRAHMAHAFGNLCVAQARVTLPIGAAAAETIDFLRLKKNMRIIDFVESHDGSNSAATTANFGLAAVSGGLTTYVDADYFLAAADLNAAGRNRWGNTAVYPITLDDDYYLRAVLAGTTSAGAAMDIDVTVYYVYIGNI